MTYAQLIANAAAYWPCQDDGASATVLAERGADGALTVGTTASQSVAGPTAWLPSAIDLAGDRLIDCGDQADYTVGTSFTVSVWTKFNAIPTGFAFLIGRQEAAGGDGYRLGNISSDGTLRPIITGNTVLSATTGVEVITTDWQHWVMTHSGVNSANEFGLYLNGSPVALTDNGNPSASGDTRSSSNFGIGGRPVDNGGRIDAAVAGAGVWERVLSLAEIQSLAAGPSVSWQPPPILV